MVPVIKTILSLYKNSLTNQWGVNSWKLLYLARSRPHGKPRIKTVKPKLSVPSLNR
jgi:hypothetical protein